MSIPRASDSGPQVRVKYDYYPYGMLWNNPDLQDEESRIHDHAYQDKEFLFGEYDGTVGIALYDFHARMYDPATGRWLVPDPAEQFANPYLAMFGSSYVLRSETLEMSIPQRSYAGGNNPVSMIDPTGTMTWDDIVETDNDEWYYELEWDPKRKQIEEHRKVKSAEEKAQEAKEQAERIRQENVMFDMDRMQSFDQSHLSSDTDPPGSKASSSISWGPNQIYTSAGSKWGYSGIDLTANLSANVGGAMVINGFGFSGNYAGVVVAGLKDSKLYFAGNNNGQRHVFSGYSLSTPLISSVPSSLAQKILFETAATGFENEIMRIGGKDGQIAYEKSKLITLGFWYTEVTRDYINKTEHTQMGFEVGWSIGLGLVFDTSIQIPLYND